MKVKPPSSSGTTQKKIPPSSSMAGKSRYTRLTEKRNLRNVLPNLGGVLLGIALGLGGGALLSSAYFSYERQQLRSRMIAQFESRERGELLACLQQRTDVEAERDNALARATVCELDLAHYKAPGASSTPARPMPPAQRESRIENRQSGEAQGQLRREEGATNSTPHPASPLTSPAAVSEPTGTSNAEASGQTERSQRADKKDPLPPLPPPVPEALRQKAALLTSPPLPPRRPILPEDDSATTPKFDSLETLVSAQAQQPPPRPPTVPTSLEEGRKQSTGTKSVTAATIPSAATSSASGVAGKAIRAGEFILKVGESRTVWEGLEIHLVAVSRRNSGKFCVLGGSDFNGARIPSGQSLVLQRGGGAPLHFSASVTGMDKCRIEVEERQ